MSEIGLVQKATASLLRNTRPLKGFNEKTSNSDGSNYFWNCYIFRKFKIIFWLCWTCWFLLIIEIKNMRCSVSRWYCTYDFNFQIFWKCIYLTVYVVIISSSWIKYYRPNPSLFVDHFQKWRSNCFDKLVAFDRDA